MLIYKVGGVVRDRLLGLPSSDCDWVVVGATPAEMLRQGYKKVGKDFPVFLHPETKDEYALARTERKVALGYSGFEIDAAPDVSLTQDLARRDLTINAMAETPDGEIIDPFSGQKDLEKKLLRHVSSAFSEDPVRVLRIARFAARFAYLGFTVADETMDLMRQMSASGEIDALVPERVWTECSRALLERQPSTFFQVLRNCGALRSIFPELDALFGVPQRPESHPEVDSGIHTLMVLEQSALLSDELVVRFSALVHDLGKATTQKSCLPSHKGHEARSAELVRTFCKRLRVPNDLRNLALLVALYHGQSHSVKELAPGAILILLKNLDAFRRPDRFAQFLLACEADSKGRAGFEQSVYSQAKYLRACFEEVRAIAAGKKTDKILIGKEIGEAIDAERVQAITMFIHKS